jgi:UDPglucose--hexose-1-phosphate uridylyltransferase
VFDDLRQELTAARYYYAHKQRCLYCDILRQERQEGVRVVEETPRFLIYTPYGSRAPFETWLVPTTHRHCFGAAAPEELADLARALQAVFRRLHAVRPGAPVELKLHTAPNSRMQLRSNEWQSLSEDFHWHVELAPNGNEREEVGGFAVNPVPPEEAARLLRQVEKPSSEEIRLR